MLNKILTVTILILLIWLSNENLKTKKINIKLNYQLELVQEDLSKLKDANQKENLKTHTLLDQIIQQREITLANTKTLKKQVSKKKAKAKAKSKPLKKEPENLQTLSTQYILDIDKKIKNKKLLEASKKLSKLKKLLWKQRNNKKFNKDKIISALSPIDILQKKLQENDSESVYTTELIKLKLKKITHKEGTNDGKK